MRNNKVQILKRTGLFLLIGFMLLQVAATYPQLNSVTNSCSKLFPASGKWGASFFDLIDKGTCWSCPKGFKRTAASVKAGNACVGFKKATNVGKYGCKRKYGSNAFFDPIDGGSCWTCPSGYKRTVFSVKSGKACEKWSGLRVSHSKASKRGKNGCNKGFKDPIDGGTCWTCPSGAKRTIFSVKSSKACEVTTKALKRGKGNLGKELNALTASQQAEINKIVKNLENKAKPFITEVDKISKQLKRSGLSPDKFRKYLNNNQLTSIDNYFNAQSLSKMMTLNLNDPANSPSKISRTRRTNNAKIRTMSVGVVADASILFGGNIEAGVTYDLTNNSRRIGRYATAGWSLGASAGADNSLVFGFWTDKDISGYGEGVTVAATYYAGMALSFWWANSASDNPGKFLGFTVSPQFGVSAEAEYGRNITSTR